MKSTILCAHNTPQELIKQSRKRSGKEATRLLCIVDLLRGSRPVEVSKRYTLSFESIRLWVKRYNKEGMQGLYTRNITGRPVRLSKADQEQFKRRISETAQT